MEDIELNRNNEGYLNAVGAQRIPDPTTAGDFTRRFTPKISEAHGEHKHGEESVWSEGRKEKFKEALIDGRNDSRYLWGMQGGMNISHKGIYAPLIISLGKYEGGVVSEIVLGNMPSHDGSVKWIDLR